MFAENCSTTADLAYKQKRSSLAYSLIDLSSLDRITMPTNWHSTILVTGQCIMYISCNALARLWIFAL
jgi:hypothetical protein